MIDCFMFFNELDLLEIRLNYMAPYVERVVLCECPITHSGKQKPLYYQENRERFKDFPITHIIADRAERFIGFPWAIENYQRECLLEGIKNEPNDALILVSDIDEIPDMSTYEYGTQGFFSHELYYYYVNLHAWTIEWKGTFITRKESIETLNKFRNARDIDRLALKTGRGWHFSTLGSQDNIINKIESFAHQEVNTEELKSKIGDRIKQMVDPYNRDPVQLKIQMPSGPKYLLNNYKKYPDLFYRGK